LINAVRGHPVCELIHGEDMGVKGMSDYGCKRVPQYTRTRLSMWDYGRRVYRAMSHDLRQGGMHIVQLSQR